MRWDPGYLCSGNAFEPFWTALSDEPSVERRGLFIGGRGFDPRTFEGPSAIVRSGFPITACRLIRLTNPYDSPDRPRNQDAAENEAAMRALFRGSDFNVWEIAVRNANGTLVGSSQVRGLFAVPKLLAGFTDVIVDVTALPTSVSFPLLGTLITLSDRQRGSKSPGFNLHCIVCENADLDERIVAEGGDAAEYIDPFRGRSGLAGESDPITIWAPVLGERQTVTLRKIFEMLRPEEVKPFLPSPSLNPRRGDELVSEYHALLFDTWDVDPRGFIYADERDPFDIYRQMSELSADYTQSLSPLGTANTVVSSHSSKLLSLGALLAAFEHSLGVAHVEPTGYTLEDAAVDLEASELFEIWLTGEAYDET